MDVSTGGTSMMNDGIETYVFRIGLGGARTIAELTRRGTYAVNVFLASLYMYINRPEPDDIISAQVSPADVPEEFEVTLWIRRGHYTIGAFMKHHLGHRIEFHSSTTDHSLYCYDCHKTQAIAEDALSRTTLRWLNR